jgi:hypothetical protein
MLYVDNLQHGLPIEPFTLPRCAILDSPTIDKKDLIAGEMLQKALLSTVTLG